MLGAGVFVVFAPAASAAGGAGLLVALALAGLIAFCNATSSARLAARYPESGGTYVYGRERLHPFAGFVAGWGFVVGKTASCAAMALTVGAYVWPGRARLVAVLAVVAVTAVNLRGVGRTATATRVLVAVVLTVLAVVAVTGAPQVTVDRLGGGGDVGARGVLTAAGLLFFAFAGYARIATLGEEVRDPERTIPRAVPLALGAVLAVYLTLAVVALGVLGTDRLAAASAPLVEVVTGESPAQPAPAPPVRRPPATVARETGSDAYAYEVQYLLDATDEAVTRLRAELAALGDSLAVVGDGSGTWNVHVHVNDVGAAVEAGVVAGRPHRITVTRFADQAAPTPGPAAVLPDGRAAVVVATGAGIAELFAAEGAVVVPANPSTGELLDAIRATGAARVVVLPNDPNTQSVASAAAKEAHGLGVKVSVVPTRSPVQALAALAVRDPQRRFEDDVIAMAEAAGACRYAEVCHAGREALTVAGPCRPGDVLALVEGEVHLIGQDLTDTCTAVVDRMLGGGGELVTLLCGADAPAGLADRVRAHVERSWPFVEVQAYEGGQPHYPLLVGVE